MERLIRIVKDEIGDGQDTNTCSNLIESNILDSFSIMNIIIGIEEEYHIQISAEDIVPEHFYTIDAMWELVKKYL